MFNDLNVLCTKKQIFYLFLVLFSSILVAILELLSLGSIPIFASAMIGGSLPESFNFLKKIDVNSWEKNKDELIFLGSLFVASIFVFKNIFFGLVMYFENYVIKIIRTDLGVKLFRYYLDNDYSFHLKTNPSILLRNVEGEVSHTTTVILRFIKLFREVLILVTIFILLLVTDFKITITIFSFLFLFVTLFFLFTKKIVEINGKKMQFIRAKKIQHINQSFSSIKDIKMMNKEDYITNLTYKNVLGYENPFLVNTTINSLPKLFIESLIVVGVVIFSIILFSMGQTLLSILPILSLMVVAAIRLFPSFTTISNSLIAIKTYRPSYKLVIKELINYQNKMEKNLKNKNLSDLKFNDLIEIKNLNFSYEEQGNKIIDNLNFKILKGKKIGFIGISGSGKSTILNLIIGLLKPDKGTIEIDGKSIENNLRNWQNLITYIPQEIYLIDDTIKKNIAFGVEEKEIDENKIDMALKYSESKEFVNNLPKKIDTIVGDKGTRLSGGQKQRIGIARALYNLKDIIVIDEGTSSLDVENEKNVIENIFLLGKNKTLLMISHNHETLKSCDELILIENGTILDRGNFSDLNTKHNFINFFNDKNQ